MAIHHINKAPRYSDKVISMQKDKVVYTGKPSEVSKQTIERH